MPPTDGARLFPTFLSQKARWLLGYKVPQDRLQNRLSSAGVKTRRAKASAGRAGCLTPASPARLSRISKGISVTVLGSLASKQLEAWGNLQDHSTVLMTKRLCCFSLHHRLTNIVLPIEISRNMQDVVLALYGAPGWCSRRRKRRFRLRDACKKGMEALFTGQIKNIPIGSLQKVKPGGLVHFSGKPFSDGYICS